MTTRHLVELANPHASHLSSQSDQVAAHPTGFVRSGYALGTFGVVLGTIRPRIESIFCHGGSSRLASAHPGQLGLLESIRTSFLSFASDSRPGPGRSTNGFR